VMHGRAGAEGARSIRLQSPCPDMIATARWDGDKTSMARALCLKSLTSVPMCNVSTDDAR